MMFKVLSILPLEKSYFVDPGFQADHDHVHVCQDGAAQEESEVAANFPDDAGVVSDQILLVVLELEVLEPDGHHPV